MKKPADGTDMTGRGAWRITFNEAGEVVTIELWQDGPDSKIYTYEAARVIPL